MPRKSFLVPLGRNSQRSADTDSSSGPDLPKRTLFPHLLARVMPELASLVVPAKHPVGQSVVSWKRAHRWGFQACDPVIGCRVFTVLLVVWSCFTLSCDTATGPGYKESGPFVSVFYWGAMANQIDNEPNKGVPVSFVVFPIWVSDGTILTYSAATLDKQFVRGVFEVNFDPATYEFRSVRPFDVGYVISSLDYDPATGTLLVARKDRDGSRDLVRGALGDGVFAVEDTVVGMGRSVLSGRFLGGRDSVVYYASPENDPASTGFYFTNGDVDSLLVAASISVTDAQTFVVSASQNRLVYGVTSITGGDEAFEVHVVNTQSMRDTTILARDGVFRGAAISPDEEHEIIVAWSVETYLLHDESYFSFFDADLIPGTTVDVRTTRCTVCSVQSAMPVFSPDGNAVAFSSRLLTQELGEIPWGLWVYKR